MKVLTEALDYPDDRASFHFEDGPMSLVVDGGVAEEHDWADRPVGLGLLESGAKPVAARVAEEPQFVTTLDGGVPVGGSEDRRGGLSSVRMAWMRTAISGVETKLVFFKRRCSGRRRLESREEKNDWARCVPRLIANGRRWSAWSFGRERWPGPP